LYRFDDAGRAGPHLLFNIDGYSAFNSKYPWESWADWAWKAVVGSIADLIAKGAEPQYIGFAVGLSERDDPVRVSEELGKGVKEACEAYNLMVIKADTNQSREDAWIAVASIGRLVLPRPIPRRGAQKKAFVYTTLVNGYGRLTALYRRFTEGRIGLEEARSLHRRPRAPLGFLSVAKSVPVEFSIDVSDGLARSLGLLAESNMVAIEISDLPDPPDLGLLRTEGEEAQREVLYGGEEYEIVFASASPPEAVLSLCRQAGIDCALLGYAYPSSKAGVYVRGVELEPSGWQHFADARGERAW